ncbi:GNAT family N-acetyltransferase [Mesorhizobium sp. LHD-90]|uniref:GNAT family N-acetyltransferase n=1 Tax=Mesorhizobium sp. LHD-90 TaxID=3071414 RepID=UPI0027E18A33|nr:GNAT family N-acetyltransferase [Mesorhizobium sp. LHD-90]MDQ6436170.1 GNAT family N-acetyltransferase [Mesorhizobium sp. LHD-90]
MNRVKVAPLQADFDDWDGLLALVRRAFSYMDGIIDPPSSAHQLTADSLRTKARTETIFLAHTDGRLAGCVALAECGDHFYLGKLAVEPDLQGKGIGRLLVEAAERFARVGGKPVIELQTRIELEGNQRTFARLGFLETGRTAHPGFDRPTSITMRRVLA